MTDKEKDIRDFAAQAAYKGIDIEKTFDVMSELLKPAIELARKNETYLKKIMGLNENISSQSD